jgi:hypothetical protein
MCRNVRSASAPPSLGPLTLEAVQLPARRNSGVLVCPEGLDRDRNALDVCWSILPGPRRKVKENVCEFVTKMHYIKALGQEILSQAIPKYPPEKSLLQ